MLLNNQKGVVHIFGLLILLVGIVVGVWLVQHKTNLFPKAQEANYIQIVDKDGNPITETSDPNVYLKITLPPGWELPVEKTSGLVKEAFAQQSCPQSGEGTTTTFNQTTYDKCVDNQGGSNDPASNTLCKNGTKYRCFWSGAPAACISGKDETDFNFDCLVSSSTSTSTSKTPILDKLTIYQISNYIEVKGDGTEVTSNFNEYLNKPIPWVLDSLPSYVEEDKRKVFVKFVSYVQEGPLRKSKIVQAELVLAPAEILFKNPNYQPPVSPSPIPKPESSSIEPKYEFRNSIPTYQVDVYIHNVLSNRDEIANWARDTIDNYINNRFAKAGINKQVKVDKIIADYDKTAYLCPDEATVVSVVSHLVGVVCKFPDNKIRVYIHQNDKDSLYMSWATIGNEVGTIRLFMPVYPKLDSSPMSRIDKQLLAHEMGHIFELPDYYWEDVAAENNKVVPIGITANIKDIMWCGFCKDKDYFSSDSSAWFINKSIPKRYIPPYWYASYQPGNIKIKIIDDKGLPVGNVKIEAFPQTWDKDKNEYIIPNTVNTKGSTNGNGEFDMGIAFALFNNNTGNSVFLRVTNKGEVRYAAITRSLLYPLYFQGFQDSVSLSLQFSKLVKYIPGTYYQVLRLLGQPAITTPELSLLERELLDEHTKQHLQESGLIPQ